MPLTFQTLSRCLAVTLIIVATGDGLAAATITAHNATQLDAALGRAGPGDTVVMGNGVWSDVAIRWSGQGTAAAPVVLRAEDFGQVTLEGTSTLRLGGEHLVVQGLVFRNGHASAGGLIEFMVDGQHVANDCRVTECAIDHFNPSDRFQENTWVVFFGRRNRLDHCYLGGKLNAAPTLIVRLNDERHRENHHRIDHNYFGERPRLGSNGGETIRVGVSTFCLTSSRTVIEDNFFEHCSGEVEIVSIKSCDNVVRGNTFWECEGVVALRHGDRNVVEGNYFIGNGKPHTGGVRVINADHVVRDNHFQDLMGERFFGTLPVMDGVPHSPLNRYVPVRNVLIEDNHFFNCAPIAFGVGKDNERTVPPQGCRFVDNVIFSEDPGAPYQAIDDVSGISFAGNQVAGDGQRPVPAGFAFTPATFTRTDGGLYAGGDYRPALRATRENCGPSWYTPEPGPAQRSASGGVTVVAATPNALLVAVEHSAAGDTLELAPGAEYAVDRTITVGHPLTLRRAGAGDKPVIRVTNNKAGDAIFTIEDGGSLTLGGLRLDGHSDTGVAEAAITTADQPMIDHFDLRVDNCDFENLDSGRAGAFVMHKSTFADTVSFTNCRFEHISGYAISLHAEWEDKGRYNAGEVILRNCFFKDDMFGALDLYRGGNDESTTGPKLRVDHCTFVNVGNMELGSVLQLIGVQDGDVRNCLFVDSGRSGRAVKLEDPRWCKLLVSHCDLWHAGRIESFYPDRRGPGLIEIEPAFVDAAAGDFRLKARSELSGRGDDGKDLGSLWQDGELRP